MVDEVKEVPETIYTYQIRYVPFSDKKFQLLKSIM